MTPRHTGAIFPKNSAAIDPDQSFKSIFIFNTGRDGELMTASIDPKDKLVHYSWGVWTKINLSFKMMLPPSKFMFAQDTAQRK
jgi:hypothetical protein